MTAEPVAQYAPYRRESAADYRTRLDAIANPNATALAAGRIIATAMQVGSYDPFAEKKEPGTEFLDTIEFALRKYRATTNLLGVRDEVVELAARTASKVAGRDFSLRNTKTRIANRAAGTMDKELESAINKAWRELKDVAGVDEQTSANNVIAAIRDINPDIVGLAEQICSLRDSFRGAKGKK